MIQTVQDLVPGVDVQSLAQDVGKVLGLDNQPQQDAQVMQQQLQTQTIPEIDKETQQASLSSMFARKLAERAAKRAEAVAAGKAEQEARDAARVADSVEIKSQILDETKLSDLDESDPYQINFDTIKTNDDLRKEFGVLNEMNAAKIQAQRREVVPDEELKSLAYELSTDPETIKKVLGLKPGEILPPEYILSMKQTLQQSAKKLKDLSLKIKNGEATDKDKINFHKQWEFHSQYATQFMGVRAEYGRGLRAIGVKTDEMGADLTEAMDRMSAGMDTETMANQILMAEDTRSVTRVVDAQKRSKFGKAADAFSELFISSILSGVQTHVVNISSNVLKGITMPIDTFVASYIKADGTDIIQKGEGAAQLRGMIEANLEALDMAWRVLKTGEAYGGIDKLDVDYQRAISANALGIPDGKFAKFVDVTGKAVRFSTDNLMGAEDAFFKIIAERGAVRQLAHRKAVEQNLTGVEYTNFVAQFMDNPPKDALQLAIDTGLRATYQQQLGKAGKSIQTLRQNVPGGTLIMPFIKTPINLLYEGFVERTPLGLISKKYGDAIKAGGAEAQMAKAKLMVGTAVNTALLTTFMNLEYSADSGISLIGSYPSDPRLRQAMKDAGVQENSIEYTDDKGNKKYYSFDRLEPFNSVFKLYANLMQVMKIGNLEEMNPDLEKEYAKVAAGLTLAFSEATVNQTFMKGIKDTLDALTAGTNTKKIESIIANYANAAIPHSSALKNINKAFDDTIRDADGILNKIRKNLPLISKENTFPILDNFGKEMKFENNFLPSFFKQGKEGEKDTVRREVYRIAEATHIVPVYKPKKNIGGYRLSAEQYYDYVKFATQTESSDGNMHTMMRNTINDTNYKNLSDHQKAAVLYNIRKSFYDIGKKLLYQKYPEIQKYDMDKKTYENKLLKGEI